MNRFAFRSSRIAAYESHVHPSTQRWWSTVRQQPHPYAKHPTMALYGEDLTKDSYKYTEKKLESKNIQPGIHALMQMRSLVMEVLNYERGHEEELQDAAIEIVSQTYGISPSKLRAKLKPLGQVGGGGGVPEAPEERPKSPIDPALRDEANKRVTANVIIQGAALHAYMSSHHLAKGLVDSISPQLLEMYDKLAAISHGAFYWMGLMAGGGGPGGGGGVKSGEVKLERDQNGEIIVKAEATTFPVLIQELTKGVQELLSLHGMNHLDPETHAQISEYANHPADEVVQIQSGPALWRKLITVLPKGFHRQMGRVLMILHKLPPKEFHAVMDAVAYDPPKAKEMLARILQ